MTTKEISELLNDCVVEWKLGGPPKALKAIEALLVEARKEELAKFVERFAGDYSPDASIYLDERLAELEAGNG